MGVPPVQIVVLIAGIHISQEMLTIDVLTALQILFGASSEACSAIVTTIWRPGFRLSVAMHNS